MIKRFFVFVVVSLFLCVSCQILNVPAQQPSSQQSQKVEAEKPENKEAVKTQKETNPAPANTADKDADKRVEKTKK